MRWPRIFKQQIFRQLAHVAFWLAASFPLAVAAQDVDDSIKTAAWATLLASSVDSQGQVAYESLKHDPALLDEYLESIAALSEAEFERWDRARQIAFLLNVYNAYTIRSILDAYPIKPGLLTGIAFPKNSIRQISGVWNSRTHSVYGRAMTLDFIEHEILRKRFKEPLIHLALVCAAKSCPPLRQEPYSAERLDGQLADQAKRFLHSAAGLKIIDDSRVAVSKIFDWFGEDFIWRYPGVNAAAARLMFLREFAPETVRSRLNGSAEIEFLEYDWELNEQGK